MAPSHFGPGHPAFSFLAGTSAGMAAAGVGLFLGLAAMVIGACLLRSKILGLSARVSNRDEAISNMAKELEAQALAVRRIWLEVEELRKRVSDRQESAQPHLPLWNGSNGSVNLSRRGQILRLSRKGKSVAEIAHDLNIAQGEVELVLKVHDLGQRSPNREIADIVS